ncbi:DUF6887 family protein [Gloeobacter violaceus]|uniref:DUF6887 family protein n=1 Tax=Gloeobacter violaceus TaxID=33072 RepID=UPI0038B31654
MPLEDLRRTVVSHPENQEAFEAFADRLRARQGTSLPNPLEDPAGFDRALIEYINSSRP